MARLPDFTALGESPTPRPAGGIAQYQPADIGGRLAAGIEGAGRDLIEASAIVAQTNDQQDRMVAEAALNRLHESRLNLEYAEGGFRAVKGGGAVGKQFVDAYTQRFNAARDEIEQSLQNDNQRRLFQARVPVAGLQYRSALLAHQATQTDAFNEQTETNTVDLARREIFEKPLDAGALDAGLARIDWAFDQRAKRKGWDDQTTADTKALFREKVYEDMAAILVERDPVGALAAMNRRMGIGGEAAPSGITSFDALGPDKLVQLRARAASHVAQAENRANAEIEKRQREAKQASEKLLDFVLTGQMVSPTYEQAVLAKVIGTNEEASARQLIALSYAGAMHGSKPLAQQEADLRALDAQVAAGGSSPEKRELIEKARQITSNQRRDYQENPWAAATRYGRQAPVPEVPITDARQVPQLVAQRLELIGGAEFYAREPERGIVAISPLQPSEAKAFADKLKTMPPDARAEVLGQTGSMLSAPRAAALAAQLDKHDKPLGYALKLGLDRTTAGRTVSELVLRGAQAIADKTVKKEDEVLTGWRSAIAPLVRGALGDPQAETEIMDMAFYVMAAQNVEGITLPTHTRGIGKGAADAVAMVVGQPFERAGVKTLLPRGMKEDQFDEKLRAYTPEKLRELVPAGQVYLRGSPIKITELAPYLGTYGMKLDPRTKRYTPVIGGAFVTLDAGGTQPLQLEIR